MPAVERLSFEDDTLLGGYAETIVRLTFADPFCRGRRVLDAGCGTGLGSRYLREHGAESVLGIDNSDDAIREARTLDATGSCEFQVGDLQELDRVVANRGFGAIVCFETLPHLLEPGRFLSAVRGCLEADGTFVVSTPNRAAIPLDAQGRPEYEFQHAAYTPATLETLLLGYFNEVSLWGQWLTPPGKLRQGRAANQYRYLCESYYLPAARFMRLAKRLFGRPALPPPENNAFSDAYPGDFEIAPVFPSRQPWAPGVLLAICRN